MIKYRLNFTLPAETLFALMAKMLPIEDLSVEEIVEHAPPAAPAKLKPPQQAQLAKPKRRRATRTPESYALNLKEGVNGILMGILEDGQVHETAVFKPAMKSRGYAEAGTSSALAKLLKRGIVFQPEFGAWQLTKEYRQKQSA